MEHLLFVRGDARAESNKSCMERQSRAPYFLYAVMRVLKIVEVVWSIDLEPLTFCTRRCACKTYKIPWLICTRRCAYKRWLGTLIRSP
jgi:hypothetical protein